MEHSVRRLVAQRLSRYEDLNDELRDDSLLALAGDDLTGERRVRARGHPLAGPSALNRRELGVPGEADRYKRADMEAMDDLPVAPFLEALPSPPGKIWLDATGDPLHGNQEDVSSTGTTICRCTSATMWCVFAVAACERRRGGGAGVHGRAGGAAVCCGRASVAQERLICVQTVGSSSLFAGSVSRGTGARAGDASARKSCSVSQEGRRRPSRTIRDSGVPWTRRQRERAALRPPVQPLQARERSTRMARNASNSGSSPASRGTFDPDGAERQRLRVIPCKQGNVRPGWRGTPATPGHPLQAGEQVGPATPSPSGTRVIPTSAGDQVRHAVRVLSASRACCQAVFRPHNGQR